MGVKNTQRGMPRPMKEQSGWGQLEGVRHLVAFAQRVPFIASSIWLLSTKVSLLRRCLILLFVLVKKNTLFLCAATAAMKQT
eukprot:m.319021 g.319021  ORF g.319021 m.319021 type:complete len:82 (+) comp15990_c0_seq46:1788-2033(+)